MNKTIIAVFVGVLSLGLLSGCGDDGVVQAPAPESSNTAANR